MNRINGQLNHNWWAFDEQDGDAGRALDEALADGQSALQVTTRNRLRIKRVGLVVRCQELARFLRGFGEDPWADWVESRIAEIRNGDPKAVARLLSGYSGFACITDVFLCPEAGHRLTPGDEARVNEQLLEMLAKVNELARAVRAGRG